MELNKKTLRNIFLGAAGCVVLYWLLHETERLGSVLKVAWGILSPFIIGAVFAFILNVPMRAIEKKLKGIKKAGGRRALAIALTMLVVLLLMTGVVWLLVPQIIKTVQSLAVTIPQFVDRVVDQANGFLSSHPELRHWLAKITGDESVNLSDVIKQALSGVGGDMVTVLKSALGAVVGLGTGIFNGILSIVFCLYCLGRKEILARQGRRLIYSFLPEKFCDETVRILRMSNSTFSNFISGQCLEALILGCMFAVAMSIFRMPYMPLVSVIIAVSALVPIVGAFVGCAVGTFFILVDNPLQAVWFVVMFLVLQQIEGNMIYPKVVGTSIGLPGMWVLVAVAVGGGLMGVGGMLLMIPVASVLYTLAREITDKRLAARGIEEDKLLDHPPELHSKFKEKRKKRKEKRHLKRQEKAAKNTAEKKD